jgi:hypothetical protein
MSGPKGVGSASEPNEVGSMFGPSGWGPWPDPRGLGLGLWLHPRWMGLSPGPDAGPISLGS